MANNRTVSLENYEIAGFEDERLQKNFQAIYEAFKYSPFANMRGKIIEHTFTQAGLNQKIAHGLGWTPKDVVILRCTGDNIPDDWEESVFVHYNSNAGQSIPNSSPTVVIYEDKVSDVGDWYDATTGIFTCPYDGIYEVDTSILFTDNAWTAGKYGQVILYKNAANIKFDYMEVQANSTIYLFARITHSVPASKDDTIYAKAYQNSGGAIALYGSGYYNSIQIKRLPQKPVTFNSQSFTSSLIDCNVFYPCTVKLFVGSYLEEP